jgi:hypothetical protein
VAVEDEVAFELGVDKNQLRRHHIRALRQGRETRREQQAAAEAELASLSREETHAANAILTALADDNWIGPNGRSLLFRGIDGGGARNAADAFAAWVARGGRFICSGLSNNFSREQLESFAALKAEAEMLRA